MEEEYENTGFRAIAEAAEKLYPEQQGMYYGVQIPYVLGGPDPLDGVEIYRSEHGIPHWHYITYGFSELYNEDEETDALEDNEAEAEAEELISGYGFELTFRLKIEGETQPPVWPVNLLQNLARYVFQTGNVFCSGHYMNANGPIALEEKTQLAAMAFITDPELPALDTPNGSVEFIQVVGLTVDEMEALMCWNCEKFMNMLKPFLPLFVTDLRRTSFLEQEEVKKSWEQGGDKDGSSTGYFFTDKLSYQKNGESVQIELGAGHSKMIGVMLKARVEKGRTFALYGEQTIYFEPGTSFECSETEDGLHLCLSKENVAELKSLLQPKAGVSSCHSMPLVLTLVKTEIKDKNGNVIEVIGD